MGAAPPTRYDEATIDRYRIAAESAGIGVFDEDHRTQSLYWSPALRRMLAFNARKRASLSDYLDRVHPADRQAVSDAMASARTSAGKGEFDIEHRVLQPDGRMSWLRLRSRTYHSGRGRRRQPGRTLGIVVDVTARKAMEQALHDSEIHYRRLYDQTYEFLGLLSLDGILLDANATALAFAGLSRYEVVGKPFWDTPWWSGEPAAQRQLKEAVAQAASGHFVRFETRHRNAKGELEAVDFSLRPMLDETGQVFCLIPEGRLAPRDAEGADCAAAARPSPDSPPPSGLTAGSVPLMRVLLDTVTEGIITVDEKGIVASFNRAAEHIFGYTAEEVRGRHVDMLMPTAERASHRNAFRRRLDKQTPGLTGIGREVRGRCKDGSLFSMLLTLGEVRVGRHRVFTAVVQDLTPRKAAERQLRDVQGALHESNQLAEEVINSVNEGIVVYDKDLVCVLRNRFMAELSGVPNDQVVGRRLLQQFPELNAHGIPGALQRALAGETVAIDHPLGRVRGTVHFLPPGAESLPGDDPDLVWTWPVYHPRRARSGEVIGVIVVVSDGTARKRAEGEVKAQHARVRALVLELERAREEERQRLSRELHDEMAQLLTALRIDATWLHRKLGPDQANFAQRAHSMVELIDRIKQSIRRIASELRPRALDEEGLIPVLKSLTEEFAQRHGATCDFSAPAEAPPLNDAVVTLLYRATQEALTNIARHAQATRVHVGLRTDGDAVSLEIKDDGKGMQPADQRKNASFGLLGMRERVAGVGGTLAVETAPGRGTTIAIRVPFRASSREK